MCHDFCFICKATQDGQGYGLEHQLRTCIWTVFTSKHTSKELESNTLQLFKEYYEYWFRRKVFFQPLLTFHGLYCICYGFFTFMRCNLAFLSQSTPLTSLGTRNSVANFSVSVWAASSALKHFFTGSKLMVIIINRIMIDCFERHSWASKMILRVSRSTCKSRFSRFCWYTGWIGWSGRGWCGCCHHRFYLVARLGIKLCQTVSCNCISAR